MPYTNIIIVSNALLGDTQQPTLERKVLLVAYFLEVLSSNFKEVKEILEQIGMEKLIECLYLESKFAIFIHKLFLNKNVEKALTSSYCFILKIKELLLYSSILKLNNTNASIQ